jgi:flagellar motor switch protein FliM
LLAARALGLALGEPKGKQVAEAGQDGILRRKIAAAKAVQAVGGPGADRSWRFALARAASDTFDLALDVTGLRMAVQSLAEVLELPFAGGLIAVLQGPAEGTGLMLLTSEVVAALIEVQTLGRVNSAVLEPRKPTRTDAAMVAPLLDAALRQLECELAQEADLVWTSGFRYASFLDDPRPLGLVMEDVTYRLLTTEVSLGIGARRGVVYMALPAKGRGIQPSYVAAPAPDEALAKQGFAQALAEQVEAAGCVLDAVLGRVSLPLSRVMALEVGEVIPLGHATIERLRLSTLAGGALVEGKLGQHRGMRAIRLALAAGEGGMVESGGFAATDHSAPARPGFETVAPQEGAETELGGFDIGGFEDESLGGFAMPMALDGDEAPSGFDMPMAQAG